MALLAVLPAAHAHDPSAWGGAFRSRDFGGSWLPSDAGIYVGAAMALSIHPRDPNHLLYATDTRLLRSRNGGRDWQPEAPALLQGPVTAVAFDATGAGAAASSAAGVFFMREGSPWQRADTPALAVPARQIVTGKVPGRYLLAGRRGLFLSTDHGARFARTGNNELPDEAVLGLVQAGTAVPLTLAVVAGQLWSSPDDGGSWRRLSAGLPDGRVEAVATSGGSGNTLWAAAADAVYVSRDAGARWSQHGARLPEANTSVRALAVSDDGRLLVVATHRGVLRSDDGGGRWQQVEGALPVHLEAGLMQRDAHDSLTLYAGFALTPYAELYRRAEQGSNLLSRLDPVSLAGGGAFFLLILIAGTWLARKLIRGSA